MILMYSFTVGKDLSGKRATPPLTLDQQAVLERLNAVRDAFWFSVAGYALLTQNPTKSAIRDYSEVLSNSGLNVIKKDESDSHLGVLKYRVNFLNDISEPAALELVEIALRTMISESLSIVEEFAAKNGVKDKLHKEQWWKFSKHCRNAFSHGNKWHFSSQKGFPVQWENLTLVHQMNGQSVIGFLKWFDGLKLGSQMSIFVQNCLKSAP